jgi:acetylornithine deacetylase/succinyl-diaminopimelate desuccinylase-like protein
MASAAEIKQTFQSFKETAFKEYFDFLKIPSVSSEPKHKADIVKGAEWVRNYIKELGFKTEIWETPVHPVVFGSWDKAGPNQPTLLIYNHYDVQPADPVELWESPAFEPTVRNGEVYARGAQDNKGQCFYVLQALKTLLKATGALPVNVKLVIEGEEECGSVGLHSVLKQKQKELKADYLAIVDLGIPKIDEPSLTLGIRGIITLDVTATGSNTDLHSGFHGGLTFNPIHALVQVLGKLRDSQGKIAIPGYYDDVLPLSNEDRKDISLEFDEKAYFKDFAALPTGGERNYSPFERAWIRPTIEINGIWGGYTGQGFKTVIPAKAHAKLSCRLVSGQDPQQAGKRVADFIKAQAPEGIEIEVHFHEGGGPAVRIKPSSKLVQAFAKAYGEEFGKPCRFIYNGGSIPIVTDLAKTSGAEVVMLGLGLNTDKIHAPNEHFGLNRIEMGVQIMARALENLRK